MNAKTTMRCLATILAALAAPAVLHAQGGLGAPLKAPRGSIAHQLQLKAKLLAVAQGTTLTAALDHNRARWDRLMPDERDNYRRKARAFLAKSPQGRDEMLRKFDEWIELAAEQKDKYRRMNRWLKKVVATFSAAERDQLRQMSPERRARTLLRRRDELVAAGTLSLDAPAPSE